MEAIEDHSAYSTHYCSQDQVTEDEEEDGVLTVDLKESLEVGKCQWPLWLTELSHAGFIKTTFPDPT